MATAMIATPVNANTAKNRTISVRYENIRAITLFAGRVDLCTDTLLIPLYYAKNGPMASKILLLNMTLPTDSVVKKQAVLLQPYHRPR